MVISTCMLVLLTILNFNKANGEKTELRFHTLVPLQSQNNRVLSSDSIIPAAIMAVDDINNSPDYLPDYYVTIKFADTQVSVVNNEL